MKLEKKTEKDLQKMLAEKKAGLRYFRFGSSGSKNKNVKEGMNLRKDVARIFTELRTRELNKTEEVK